MSFTVVKKCSPDNRTMYETYFEFRERYNVGCGTSVADSVKDGLHYCELMERMTRIYDISETDLLNVSLKT